MARRRRVKKSKRKIQKNIRTLNFNTKSYLFFGIGLLLIVIGYITLPLSENAWYSLTLSPILILAGYCVFIPLAILYRKPKNQS